MTNNYSVALNGVMEKALQLVCLRRGLPPCLRRWFCKRAVGLSRTQVDKSERPIDVRMLSMEDKWVAAQHNLFCGVFRQLAWVKVTAHLKRKSLLETIKLVNHEYRAVERRVLCGR